MKFIEVLFSRTGALALLVLAVLSACTVVVDEEGPGPRPRPPRPGPDFCTREYEPVCGQRRGDRQTFSNACMAERAGYRVIRYGECRRVDDDDMGGGGFCTREYAPVCGQSGRRLQMFGNACEARAAGFRVIDNGPC